MARHLRPKMMTPDTVRAVDREYRDLVMSLRALAALLHDPSPDGESNAWEPVLANILDAELNQLAVLMGDVTAALRMENETAGPIRHVDLSRVLESAVRRTGSKVLVAVGEPIPVSAHPDIVAQSLMSALSLGMRVAGGRVKASAKRQGDEGVVSIVIPTDEEDSPRSRLESRLSLLRRIVAAEGGRVGLGRRGPSFVISVSFPCVDRISSRKHA